MSLISVLSAVYAVTPIWSGVGEYAYLRREVALPSAIDHASVNITAVPGAEKQRLLGAYRLYVNGVAVGTGPGRGQCNYTQSITAADCTFVDQIDLTAVLMSSQNVTLAIQGFHSSGHGKIAASFTFSFRDGSEIVVHTDSSWDAFDATALHAPYRTTGGSYQAPRENLRAALYPEDWVLSTFKATAEWSPAVVQSLFDSMPKPTKPLAVKQVVPSVVLAHNASSVLYDFTHEVMAALELDAVCEGYIQVTMGEELVADEILYPMRTGNQYRYMWECKEQGVSKFRVHEYALFRYFSLRFCKKGGAEACTEGTDVASLPLLTPGALVSGYPYSEEESSLTTSNDMLNRIWQLCKNTIRDTTLDTMTDSNTRERLPYEADGFISGITRWAMVNGSEWQRHSYAHVFNNPTWPTEWRQFTPLLLLEHYMESKDVSLVGEYWDYLYKSTYIGCVNQTTQLVDFTHCSRPAGTREIVDWPPVYRAGYVMTDVNTVVNCFTVAALRALATLGRAAGKPASLTTLMEEQAARTEAAIKTLLFDTAKGLFFDGLDGAQNHTGWHAQTNTLWLLNTSGLARETMKRELTEQRLVGSVYGVVSYFFGFYETFPEDQGHTMLEMLTQCDTNSWCHMLEVGATATMEAWSREGKPNLSWSHPWGTVAVAALKKFVFGLTATSPGYDTWQLRPQSGNLTSGSATFPQTLHGPFHLSLKRSSTGEFSLHYTAPLTTEGEVCLPVQGSAGDYVLRMDGEAVDVAAVTLRDTYLCAQGPSGEHVFSLTRK